MKNFIKRILYFLIPVVLLSYPIDIFISSFLKKSNDHAEGEYSTWNDLYSGNINAEIIISGSSRAVQHIDPRIIQDDLKVSAYNIGMLGQSFELQHLRHLILLKYTKRPNIIIHSLDVSTLTSKTEFNSDQFLPYMLFDSLIREATIDYKGFDLADFNFPLLRYYRRYEAMKAALILAVKPDLNPQGRWRGYLSRDESWNQDFEKAKAKAKNLHIKLDSKVIKMFEDYIISCKRLGIKLILIYSPEFIEGQDFVENRSEIFDIYSSLSKKYDVPFYDYSTDELSYNKEYFYNVSHLNKEGANLFTRKLIRKLIDDKYAFNGLIRSDVKN